MANIASKNIYVFPLAKNRSIQRTANLMYENNISNIIRQLVDYPGFVITDEPDVSFDGTTLTFGSPFEFNLYGYYFRIEGETSVDLNDVPSGNMIYASIQVDPDKKEINFQDDGIVYDGLSIVRGNQLPTNKDTYCLQLFDIGDGGNITLHKDSLFKMNNSSINIKRIDGKRAL